jgi:hypothetical protein
MPYDIGFGEVGEDIIGYANDETFDKKGVFFWTDRLPSRKCSVFKAP